MEDKDKKPAQTLREYLRDLRESTRQVGWVFTEFSNRRLVKAAAVLLSLSLVATGLSFVVPWFTGRMLDGVVNHDLKMITVAIACSLGVTLASFLVDVFTNRGLIKFDADMAETVETKVSGLFFEKSLGQHLREGSDLSVGNVQKGRSQVENIVSDMTFNVFPTLVQVLVTYLLLWWLSATIALVMTGVGIVYAISSLWLNHLSAKHGNEVDEKDRLATRYRNDRWNGVERCKNNGQDVTEVKTIIDQRREVSRAFLNIWLRIDPLFQVRGLAMDIVGVAVYAYGFYLVWNGHMTIGAVMPLASWSRSFVSGLRQVSWYERRLQKALPAITSLRKAIFVEPDIVDRPGAIELPAGEMPRVEFRHIGFTYAKSSDEKADAAKPAVLRDISLDIAPYEKVAVLGPSGAGKTTLSRLLLRYADPTEGGVFVNGHDLREYRHASWIAAVGHIAQQPQVFDGTIRDNLVYGLSPEARAKTTDDELWEVMRKLKIDFGSRLTEGLDTKVGLKGLKLSGGESQRLLIGAAVIRHPRFMIIDEATSSLDSTTEREVQEGLEAVLSGGMSAVVIAHRLSTVRRLCTKFVVLRDADKLQPGEPQVEAVAGSFEELYAVSPTFRHLADDQGLAVDSVPRRSQRSEAAE